MPQDITAQQEGALSAGEKKLEELLLWAHGEAQAFAERSKVVHLYE